MGGSSSGTVSAETVPAWLKPYLTKALDEGSDLYDLDSLSHVEGLTQEQKDGMASIKGSALNQKTVAENSGAAADVLGVAAAGGNVVDYDNTNTQAIKDAAIRKSTQAFGGVAGDMASSGLVGGRRAELVKSQRDAELASSLADIDYNDYNTRRSQALSSAGAVIDAGSGLQDQYSKPGETVTGVGKGIQEQNQKEADGAFQGYSRWISTLQGVPSSPNSTSAGGK